MTRTAPIAAALLLPSCLAPPARPPGRQDPAGEHRVWLVMVFMNADSGGDSHEWVLMDDLEEMDSSARPGPVHLVLQASRCGIVAYDGAWKGTRRYYVDGMGGREPDRFGGLRIGDPPGPVDPSDGDALVAFATWAAERYPADRRMLVVEAHGSGWRGLSPCDIQHDPGCLITIPDGELARAIGRIDEAFPLDVVALDACLMGMWEVGFALAGTVPYAVTSQEMGGPLLGSWHDLLPRLARGPDDPRDVCASIPAMLAGERTRANSATRSCVDLSRHASLTGAVDDLAREALASPGATGSLRSAVLGALHFAKPAHRDLGDIAARIAEDEGAPGEIREAARKVLDALGSYVVAHESSPFVGVGNSHGVCGGQGEWGTCDRSTGVAIWAPVGGAEDLMPLYAAGPWSATLWDEAIRAIAPRTPLLASPEVE